MPIEITEGGTTITGGSIGVYRLLMLKSALQLEIRGIRVWRNASAYAILKKELGLKGNRQKVLDQATAIILQKAEEDRATWDKKESNVLSQTEEGNRGGDPEDPTRH
jgi:hypothetical protein